MIADKYIAISANKKKSAILNETATRQFSNFEPFRFLRLGTEEDREKERERKDGGTKRDREKER
jgi:hypothetical protein